MALDFKLKDVMHRIVVKFYPAFLPDAKKPYNLRAVYQPELDIHGIASKAEMYNISTAPKVIEEGSNALMELIYYLAADGYKIKTPVFNLSVRIPGEYEGNETHLPEGTAPEGRLNLAADLRKYLRDTIELQFDGIDERNGYIADALDQVSGETNTVVTPAGILAIHGLGIKIASDAAHAGDVGVFFEKSDGSRIFQPMTDIAVNEPRTVKLRTYGLVPSEVYYVVIRTQASSRSSTTLLKEVREVKSDFTLTAL